ncbi:MAG: hypothetical protein Q8T03_09635 [Bacteroidota bacterium]|nr:hypothetical protein [Bacteroidota bacterium]
MDKITSTNQLREKIQQLEIKQVSEGILLKEQFKVTYESLKPVNIIKNKISELVTSSDLTGNVLDGILGLTAGYLTKKATVGSSHNPLKKILGSLLQMGVTSIVTKNTGGIKAVVSTLIGALLKKKDDCAEEDVEEEIEEDDEDN